MSSLSIEAKKSKVRKSILNQFKSQSASERLRKSTIILDRVSRLSEFQKSRVIMFYVSMFEEGDTLPLLKKGLREGRVVTVPFVDQKTRSLLCVQITDPENDLVAGSYGILEPKKHLVDHFGLTELEMVLVPGLAFDRTGHRLGRGKGYYDRFLTLLPKHIKTIGLAYDFQLLDSIPVNDLDVAVQHVITN